jgi:hypothetical protein
VGCRSVIRCPEHRCPGRDLGQALDVKLRQRVLDDLLLGRLAFFASSTGRFTPEGDDGGEDGDRQAEQGKDYQEAIEGARRRQIPRVITLWSHTPKT